MLCEKPYVKKLMKNISYRCVLNGECHGYVNLSGRLDFRYRQFTGWTYCPARKSKSFTAMWRIFRKELYGNRSILCNFLKDKWISFDVFYLQIPKQRSKFFRTAVILEQLSGADFSCIFKSSHSSCYWNRIHIQPNKPATFWWSILQIFASQIQGVIFKTKQ